ncbi:transposase [Pandoraea cepalis]|uniref:transposase n=1 Tax=Pandoraea cepalis TaxID=2508294 RepID=UPI001FE43E38|nr:transposase [Pandoraea cepalis]
MVERVIRTLKERCVNRQRFETIQHAASVIGARIRFNNHRRPHQALGLKTPG